MVLAQKLGFTVSKTMCTKAGFKGVSMVVREAKIEKELLEIWPVSRGQNIKQCHTHRVSSKLGRGAGGQRAVCKGREVLYV